MEGRKRGEGGEGEKSVIKEDGRDLGEGEWEGGREGG